jgi:hypothetical protein
MKYEYKLTKEKTHIDTKNQKKEDNCFDSRSFFHSLNTCMYSNQPILYKMSVDIVINPYYIK